MQLATEPGLFCFCSAPLKRPSDKIEFLPPASSRLNNTALISATGHAIGVYGMQATLLGTMLPELSRTFSPAQSGTIASVQSLGLIAASLLTGPVIDRAGNRAGLLTGLSLIALALAMLPAARTYLPLLGVMLLLGVGGGVISTSTNTLAADIGKAMAGASQARMLNFLNVFFGIGGLITPALGALCTTTTLRRVIALLALGAVGVHTTIRMPLHSHGGRGFRGAAEARHLLGFRFISFALFLFLYVAAELAVWNWFAAYLTERHIDRGTALRILSFGFATGIIAGRVCASRLTHFRPANVTLACSVLMAITTSAMLLVDGPFAAAVAVFCAGLSMAPVYPTTLALVGEAFPRGTATAIGVAVTVGWIGVAVSSKLIGMIAGDDPAGLGTALLVIPGFSVLMILLSLSFRSLPVRALPVGTLPVSANPEQ